MDNDSDNIDDLNLSLDGDTDEKRSTVTLNLNSHNGNLIKTTNQVINEPILEKDKSSSRNLLNKLGRSSSLRNKNKTTTITTIDNKTLDSAYNSNLKESMQYLPEHKIQKRKSSKLEEEGNMIINI